MVSGAAWCGGVGEQCEDHSPHQTLELGRQEYDQTVKFYPTTKISEDMIV